MENKIFMIIDDDEDDRFFFSDALSKMSGSIECLQADGCKEALVLLSIAKQLPHYIFLDINMPIVNGRDCLKLLKGDEQFQHIPVIVYSTSFSEESINDFHNLGALNHLNKPTNLKRLPEQILEAISGQRAVCQ